MITLYILRTLNNSLYVGVTTNLESRVERHKSGLGAEFTKRNKVDKVVYTEKFRTLTEARHRETQIKGWSRMKKENLIKYGKPVFKCSKNRY
jgi:predicted GIY-YIG superfamily endonuclease